MLEIRTLHIQHKKGDAKMANENSEDMTMEEMLQAIKKPIPKIQSGDIVKGVVLSTSDKEVFVNIGYMSDGIIEKEELTDDTDADPRDLYKPGDEILVYILEVNDGEGNISLSKKMADSAKVWSDLETWQKNGHMFDVKIKEAVKGGLTANIHGIRAFIPASQVSMNYVEDLNSYAGQTITVKVLEYDKDKNKIVLSGKEAEKDKNEKKKAELFARINKGDILEGVVKRLVKFGAFVDVGGTEGLIHLSDLSWERVNDPSEVVNVGDKVKVYVIDFDKSSSRISLGLKEISKNPWNSVREKYKIGDIVHGIITRIASFGAFVEIEPGLEGLVHVSQITDERISNPSNILSTGDNVNVKIIDINTEDKKLSLSIKEAKAPENGNYSEYLNDNKSDSMLSLGDLLKDKLKDINFEDKD